MMLSQIFKGLSLTICMVSLQACGPRARQPQVDKPEDKSSANSADPSSSATCTQEECVPAAIRIAAAPLVGQGFVGKVGQPVTWKFKAFSSVKGRNIQMAAYNPPKPNGRFDGEGTDMISVIFSPIAAQKPSHPIEVVARDVTHCEMERPGAREYCYALDQKGFERYETVLSVTWEVTKDGQASSPGLDSALESNSL